MSEHQERSTGDTRATANRLTHEHLAKLVCPVCYSGLVLKEAGPEETVQQVGEAETRTIRCMGCGRRYPILDGLPVLLADRALIETEL